jgi:hypothetical protein
MFRYPWEKKVWLAVGAIEVYLVAGLIGELIG